MHLLHIEIKNKLTVTRREEEGDNGQKERGSVFKEYVQRTRGQTQRGVGLRVGGEDGWVGMAEGSRGGKWRQMYLNNNKK